MQITSARDDILMQLKQSNIEPVCFEMEAVGIMSSFPSLVIRGICDYGDERKNDRWQKYAAATAAAFAKEFLEILDPEEVEQELPIQRVEKQMEQLTEKVVEHVSDYRNQQIDKWLSPPDPSTNLNKAKDLRHPDTGLWFLQSEQYKDWKEEACTSLWLHGLPGCGKTILSSFIIEDLKQNSTKSTLLYFFFDFNDSNKQSFEKMLRSLISQAYYQCKSARKYLDQLYAAYDDGRKQPEIKSLIATFCSMMEVSKNARVLLDALDQCDIKLRKDLLDWLVSLPTVKLHLILTSRKEYDIETALVKWIAAGSIVPILTDPVDEDIRTVIRFRLANDEGLQRWQSRKAVCEEIETKLMEKADGMFRWAVCQLDGLRDCLDLPTLRAELQSLPEGLDATYGRILNAIRPAWKSRAIRLLQFLLYAHRPLLLEEAVDVIAVHPDIENYENSFRTEDRMPNPHEIVKYCSSLVQITSRYKRIRRHRLTIEEGTIIELQIAHFSVKEYLVSERIQESFEESFRESHARATIVEVCIAYIMAIAARPVDQTCDSEENHKQDHPFELWSATCWPSHARELEAREETAVDWVDKLFTTKDALRHWLSSSNYDSRGLGSPLYYASIRGLFHYANKLLIEGADVNAMTDTVYCFSLQAASRKGHREIVQLLLDNGADVNAQGGRYGSALHAASREGHREVVQLLLDRGANVNPQGRWYGSALHAASREGHREVVQLLLDRGADANALDNSLRNVLQVASEGGHMEMVQMLLERGVDFSAQMDCALQAACLAGREDIVQYFLDKGADVNVQDGYWGNALRIASGRGNYKLVQMLLDRGADVNQQAENGHALQVASEAGHEQIVRLLLNNGADVNATGGLWGGAIQAASAYNNHRVVTLLLEHGVDVNHRERRKDTALQIASYGGFEKLAKLLLEHGADVNAAGGYNGNAIEAASRKPHYAPGRGKHRRIMRLLLQNGAKYPPGSYVYHLLTGVEWTVYYSFTGVEWASFWNEVNRKRFIVAGNVEMRRDREDKHSEHGGGEDRGSEWSMGSCDSTEVWTIDDSERSYHQERTDSAEVNYDERSIDSSNDTWQIRQLWRRASI